MQSIKSKLAENQYILQASVVVCSCKMSRQLRLNINSSCSDGFVGYTHYAVHFYTTSINITCIHNNSNMPRLRKRQIVSRSRRGIFKKGYDCRRNAGSPMHNTRIKTFLVELPVLYIGTTTVTVLWRPSCVSLDAL